MDKQIVSLRSWITLWVVLMSVGTLALAACGPETLAVGLEPTPTWTPVPTPISMSYVNDAYGFAFRYPETWTLAEEPQLISLIQGTRILRIAFGWASDPGFNPATALTGLPAGDLIYGDKIFFLERVIPAQVLEYERKDKAVFYGGPGPVLAGDLAFSIWLEDVNSADYSELDIPQELQAEVKEILESFERVEALGKPPVPTPMPTLIAEKGLATYVNDEYRLAFIYPAGWELEEIPAGQAVPGGASAPGVNLTRGALRLTMQFKRAGETMALGPGGLPAGEIEERGTVTLFGRDLPKQVLVFQDKVKSVFLSDRFEDLELYIQLDAGLEAQSDYEAIEIPESAQAAMGAILSSLTRTGESPSPEADSLTYENAPYGFSFQYPATWTAEEVAGRRMEEGSFKLADAVILTQGKFKIVVQYQQKSASAQIGWDGSLTAGGLGYAEAQLGDLVTLLGEETHEHVWTYNGGVKAVEVNTTGKSSDLILTITLADSSVMVIQDPQAATIPATAFAALDQVLATFETIQ